MLEQKIKEMYSYCEKFNLTEKEEEELSNYIEILSKDMMFLQEKINKLNNVNLNKNIELLLRELNGTKTKN